MKNNIFDKQFTDKKAERILRIKNKTELSSYKRNENEYSTQRTLIKVHDHIGSGSIQALLDSEVGRGDVGGGSGNVGGVGGVNIESSRLSLGTDAADTINNTNNINSIYLSSSGGMMKQS